MVQLELIEKDHLMRSRMADNGASKLASAQSITILPLVFDGSAAAKLFDRGSALGAEELPPTDVEAVRVVPHVHQFLSFEAFPEPRIQQRVDFSTVNNRCLTSLLRRFHA